MTKLQKRFPLDDPYEDCLLIDAATGGTEAGPPPEIPKLLLKAAEADGLPGWLELLVVLAQKTGESRTDNLQRLLPLLADAEGISSLQPPLYGPGRIEVAGQSLVSLDDEALGSLSGLNVDLPTLLVVDQPDGPHPVISKHVAEDTIEEAKAYLQSLRANGQLEADLLEAGQPQAADPGAGQLESMASPLLGQPTHYVETDATGRRVLRRRGFN
ncbi:hypothetical protein [Roseibium sp. LAB1]